MLCERETIVVRWGLCANVCSQWESQARWSSHVLTFLCFSHFAVQQKW